MALYRQRLPQLDGRPFLADGGLETTLVFLENVDLPCFAAFPLLLDQEGRQRLSDYFVPYLELARSHGAGFVLDTATWRANPDWGARLGYTLSDLAQVQRESVSFAEALRGRFETADTPMVINGVVGPRGDGYVADTSMSPAEAESYHAHQVAALAATEADMVSAITMTYAREAAGIARAAQAHAMPVVISFTVETDGRLPSGESLAEAVALVDDETGGYPAYYMINCAHPTHFAGVLDEGGTDAAWRRRIGGIRANASTMSHAELDASPELDPGDPVDLGRRYRQLREGLMQHVCVLGGCCGTDIRHLRAICEECLA